MNYEIFASILNEFIFEKSKSDLLAKISLNPSRYIGLFRPTNPKAKLLQNLLQSHEIRFGDALESIIENYFSIKGFEILPKRFINEQGENLNIDHCIRRNNEVFFIEQKVRDDHDSSKKRGQILNFENKVRIMSNNYNEKHLTGIFYFIDPDLVKNKNYYTKELSKIEVDYGVKIYLFYGNQLFTFLKIPEVWDEILINLEKWKKDLPEFPEINFDLNPSTTFMEIKDLNPIIFRKLFNNDTIFNQIVLTLFPEKKTLIMLKDYFSSQSNTLYKNLAKKLYEKLS